MNQILLSQSLDRIRAIKDLEPQIDELRIIKKELLEPLQSQYLSGDLSFSQLGKSLAETADLILILACLLAKENLRAQWGVPQIRDNSGNYLPGHLALIGMGKLGGEEIHFGSDLDVLFIFNKSGKTKGAKSIRNQEFFSRLAQRVINYLTLHTREGYAYEVDTELRPSGNAGTLVTGLDPWVSYYHEHAQIWEKQALLKARLIHAEGEFGQDFHSLFHRLIFLTPFPKDLGQQINQLRKRIEKELAKESDRRWHFKKGLGGIIEIEFIVQFIQLKMGKIFPDILKNNTLESLEGFSNHQFLSPDNLNSLKEIYLFYRKLEIFLELQFRLKEGFLDPKAKYMEPLAENLGFSGDSDLLNCYATHRQTVRQIYLNTLKV